MNAPVPSDKPSRPRGRPKKADAPIIPWDEVDRLLVHGEVAKDPESGQQTVRFPSLAELGQRYGVSKNRVWQYASKRKCLERREEAKLRGETKYDQKVTERRAEARALATADVVRVVDAYIVGFEKALDDGKVRFDSPADLDRLVRLKELLQGNADSRQEVQGGITLESIQARHLRLRAQLDALTPDLAGEAVDEAKEAGDVAAN
jgi:hypothetical protein